MIFLFFYTLATLVSGTLWGLVHPWTAAIADVVLVAILIAAALMRPRARLGGGGDAALVVFLMCAFLTAMFAVCPSRSLHLAVQIAAGAALFYLMLDGDRDSLAPMMAIVATAGALFGLGAWLFGYAPRVVAPFGLHHYAAGFLLLHLPVTWKLARRAPVWWLALAAEGAAILGTRSMAAVVALGITVLWTLRKRPALLIAALAAMAALAIYVPRTRQLLTHGEDPSLSTENRVRYLQTGVAMIAARPLGWGLGTVPLVAARFRPQIPDVMPPGEVLPHLHNLPVNLAAETGVLGLLAAAWFLWRARSLAIAPYLLFSLADYQLDMPALLLAFAACAALAAEKEPEGGTRPEGETKNRLLPPALRVATLAIAALVPFQFTCDWLPDLIPQSAAKGSELLGRGKINEAIPNLEHATRLDPYFTLAWYHLGVARHISGDRQGAVAAFAEAMLVHPVTIFAEGWDEGLYSAARDLALRRLEAIHAEMADDERTAHRFHELQAFLQANPVPPQGTFAREYSEITGPSTDLLVFHQLSETRFTSTIRVLLPTASFYIPPGLGYLKLR